MKQIMLLFLVLCTSLVSAKELHVSVNGKDTYDGSLSHSFRTINHAAQLAQPGDEIIVHAGTYREWINPARGGESDTKRITYRSVNGEKVEIKGSEIIKGWTNEGHGLWKAVIENSFFGDYNPYIDSVFGDWFNGHGRIHHTGEVFLNGKSLYEKVSLTDVIHALPNQSAADQKGSMYTWCCHSDHDHTTIWANFQKFDPNKELVEISVRRTCFYPDKPGLNYITFSGFDVSQAATQWAAPTAEQIGIVSTNWNKGWIIENCKIHDSKCSGITLGKERSTGQNVWSADKTLDGSIHYIEVIFKTLRLGWRKDQIGSHLIRNNEIFNCEQTGICGSMGGAFSTITNNYIHHIWVKRQFSGAEIAGIKLHGAIDTKIESNRMNDCGRGMWLDWMAQGTRVSKNLFYKNDQEDIFMEVNHGPTLVDNNIFLSAVSIRTQSEGGAFAHNLIAGQVCMWPEPSRFTPYHLPHSTAIAGFATILSGDDRYYNNIFIGSGINAKAKDARYSYGLNGYLRAKLPVWIEGDFYFNGAIHYPKETNFKEWKDLDPGLMIQEENTQVYLTVTFDDSFYSQMNQQVTTVLLGKTKMARQNFENPDETPLKIDRDYFGISRSATNPSSGPFEHPGIGKLKLKVW